MAKNDEMTLEEMALDAADAFNEIINQLTEAKQEVERYRRKSNSFEEVIDRLRDVVEHARFAIDGLQGISQVLKEGSVDVIVARLDAEAARFESIASDIARSNEESSNDLRVLMRDGEESRRELARAMASLEQGFAAMEKRLDARIDAQKRATDERFDELQAKTRDALERCENQISDIAEVLSVLDRIDKNTQKGFWKIKG